MWHNVVNPIINHPRVTINGWQKQCPNGRLMALGCPHLCDIMGVTTSRNCKLDNTKNLYHLISSYISVSVSLLQFQGFGKNFEVSATMVSYLSISLANHYHLLRMERKTQHEIGSNQQNSSEAVHVPDSWKFLGEILVKPRFFQGLFPRHGPTIASQNLQMEGRVIVH